MIVDLSHPQRQVEIKGPKRVKEVLRELNLIVEAHLVIRGDDLLTEDELALDSDRLEIRPVISGGSPFAAANPDHPSAVIVRRSSFSRL